MNISGKGNLELDPGAVTAEVGDRSVESGRVASGEVATAHARASWLPWAVGVVLAAGTLALYGQVSNHQFIAFDDNAYVTLNPNVQEGLSIRGLWYAATAVVASNWHPLTVLSHMVDCELFGMNAGGHHIVSVLWHAANTVLLFAVLLRMTGNVWPSAWVAALFAWHPLHVESVAWVAERKDVLSAFFWLLAMMAYWRYVQRPSWPRYAGVAAAMALGLMSKPMVVTLPCALLLLDWWPLNRLERGGDWLAGQLSADEWRRTGQLILEKLPLFGLSLVSAAITLLTQMELGVRSLESVSVGLRLRNAAVSYVDYIGQTIWPQGLAVFYPHRSTALTWWDALLPAMGLSLVTIVALLMGRSHRYLIVGWLWFLGTLIPVIGIVQVGGQARADRYMYIPMVGLLIAVAWGAAELVARYPRYRVPVVAAMSICVVLLLPVTWRQIGHWRTSETLFTHTVEVTQNNYMAHAILGNWYLELDQLDAALAHYDKALAIRPSYDAAYDGKAYALHRQKRWAEALVYYEQGLADQEAALEANPNAVNSTHVKLLINAAQCLTELDRRAEAAARCREALQYSQRLPVQHPERQTLIRLSQAHLATYRTDGAAGAGRSEAAPGDAASDGGGQVDLNR